MKVMEELRALNALSLTRDVKDWLANTRQPRVLHVFEHACNLLNERTEVLSIVHPQIGKGPFNLVIDDKFLFLENLNAQSPVMIRDKKLILGNSTIHTAGTELWSSRPDWESLHAKKDEISNRMAKLRIDNSLVYGLKKLFVITSPAYSTFASNPKLPVPNYQLQFSELSFALANANLTSAKKLASQLAGLGPGLTPSGDDFILGAIYAAWILHPPAIASVLAQAVSAAAAPLTTSLSAAWLRSAGRGDAGAGWHAFFDALIAAETAGVLVTMGYILSIGETSGVDALAGFVGVFVKWSEVRDHMP